MTRTVTSVDVRHFIELSEHLLQAAERYRAELAAAGRSTLAPDTTIGQVRSLIEAGRHGRLPQWTSSLGLSRAFGDLAPAQGGDDVWHSISAVEAFWTDELERGDFEVRDA